MSENTCHNQYGYIYIRRHESYDLYDACKLGKTKNIPERDTTYATGEIKRGFFELVFIMSIHIIEDVEKQLQIEFNKYHIQFDGGIEFYNKKIVELIEPFLNLKRIHYKKLSSLEINNLIRCVRNRTSTNPNRKLKLIITNKKYTIHKDKHIKRTKEIVHYSPRDYQTTIIEKAFNYFQEKNKGILVLTCGVGKTLISLWITKQLNAKTILIGVPNMKLLEQWEKVIHILFKNIHYLLIDGNVSGEDIELFLKANQEECIVITTYASAFKVFNTSKKISFTFDIKINDECHHLTSTNISIEDTERKYIQMLNIPSTKQLSLTATIKELDIDNNEETISNDNIEYFGEIIERKCLLWGIENNIICDYVVQTVVTDEDHLEQQLEIFNITEENDKRLFLSAYLSLKSIFDGHSHHILIYSNNTENSLKIIQFIQLIIQHNYFDIPDLYYSNYDSTITSQKQKEIIHHFKNASYGIITCVYCLGEGWDFPLLDCVIFSENMTSNIRIVQSALRANRKDMNNSSKISKIILPILNNNDWLDNTGNSDFKKAREVIYQMGLEDTSIIQKIKVSKINVEKEKRPFVVREEPQRITEFGEYDEELTNKLKIKTVKRKALEITYEKAKKIIAEYNIQNKTTYFELCERDQRLSKEPEIVFKGQFTNWIDYLSIQRTYYDLETCKNKVNEYLSIYPEMKQYYLDLTQLTNQLCNIDPLFPPYELWVEYYNVKDLRDIIIIKNKKKKTGVVL
jgi:superfamily II DNA or RNA helicase